MDKKELISSLAWLTPGQMSVLDSEQTRAINSRLTPQEALLIQQEQVAGVLKYRDERLKHQIEVRNSLQKEYDGMWMPSWASNATKAKEKEIAAQDALILELQKSRTEIARSLAKSREESRAGFKLMQDAARNGARDPLTPEAAGRLTNASRTLFETKFAVDYGNTQRLLSEAGNLYDDRAKNWGALHSGLEKTRNVCIGVVAGGVATLAAPIVFTATAAAGASTLLAGGATVVAGAGVGATTAVTIGGVSRGYENALAVSFGQKSDEEAREHIRQGVLSDARTGMISGMGGGAGGAIGKALNSTGAILPTSVRIGHGAVRGAGSAAVTIPTSIGFKVHDAYSEIAAVQTDSNLTAEDLKNIKDQILTKHRVTPNLILKDGVIDLAVSAISGGAGARFDVSREAAKGFLRNAAIEAAEFSYQTGAGLGKIALKGEKFNQQTITDEVTSNIISGFQGRSQSPGRSTIRPLEELKGSFRERSNSSKTSTETTEPIVLRSDRVVKRFEELGYQDRSRVLSWRNPLDTNGPPPSPEFSKLDMLRLRFMARPSDDVAGEYSSGWRGRSKYYVEPRVKGAQNEQIAADFFRKCGKQVLVSHDEIAASVERFYKRPENRNKPRVVLEGEGIKGLEKGRDAAVKRDDGTWLGISIKSSNFHAKNDLEGNLNNPSRAGVVPVIVVDGNFKMLAPNQKHFEALMRYLTSPKAASFTMSNDDSKSNIVPIKHPGDRKIDFSLPDWIKSATGDLDARARFDQAVAAAVERQIRQMTGGR